jgi:hypothetical protein
MRDACPERGPEPDEVGRLSIFPYGDDCGCRACTQMRMRRSSYTRWTFARAVEWLHDLEVKLWFAESLDEMARIQYDLADMRQAIADGLQKWEGPASSPGRVN